MVAAAIPYILQGASLLGGVLGKKKNRQVSPEYLREHFGPEQIAARARELSQRIMSSPYGQQLMASAAESGQSLQTGMAERAAASGLSPDTGGQSAASDFATSAAGGAQSAFERGAKADVFGRSLGVAQDQVAFERQHFLDNLAQKNAEPSMWQKVGNVASQAAAMFPPTSPVTATTGAAGTAAGAVAPGGAGITTQSPNAALTQASGFGTSSMPVAPMIQQFAGPATGLGMPQASGAVPSRFGPTAMESRWRASLQPSNRAVRRVGKG